MRGLATRGALRVAAALVSIGLSLALVVPAAAFIPAVDRAMKAIAEVNRTSKRSEALQLDVTMRIGDREPVARGELISHPSGLARLELTSNRGRVVRYLLSGRELLGAADGRQLDPPRPLLQPFFFLQPASEVTLRAAFESFGVMSDSIGLATCGDADCFVIGDPRLAAPLPRADIDPDRLGDPLAEPMDDAAGEAVLTGPSLVPLEDDTAQADGGTTRFGSGSGRLGLAEDARLARVWVDTRELQVRRIDRASGVFTIFGPIVSFEQVLVPAWFEVHEPGAETVRFEIDRAVAVNAPPTAFSRKWLLAPVEPAPGAPVPGPGDTPPGSSGSGR